MEFEFIGLPSCSSSFRGGIFRVFRFTGLCKSFVFLECKEVGQIYVTVIIIFVKYCFVVVVLGILW